MWECTQRQKVSEPLTLAASSFIYWWWWCHCNSGADCHTTNKAKAKFCDRIMNQPIEVCCLYDLPDLTPKSISPKIALVLNLNDIFYVCFPKDDTLQLVINWIMFYPKFPLYTKSSKLAPTSTHCNIKASDII